MSFSQLVKESFQAEFKGVKSPDYNYQRLYRERMIEFRKPTENPLIFRAQESSATRQKKGLLLQG